MQVIQAPTWEVNPAIKKEVLELEEARDPELFRVEYGAEFSQSLASFLEPTLVDAAVNRDRGPLFPLHKFKGQYVLSLDPAKGNRDNYTACICHYDGERLVVDLFHQFQSSYVDGSKQQVSILEVEEWIEMQHRLYQFSKVVLDQYNSQGTIQKLSNLVPISELTWTVKTKTQAYSKLRELFNAGNIDLYLHEKAIAQIKGLTVTYRAGGTWSVSGGTAAAVDDFAAALAGAVLIASAKPTYNLAWLSML